MNTTPPRSHVSDLVNLVASLAPWLFPDIPLLIKTLISLFLVGTLVLSFFYPNLGIESRRPVVYILALLLPTGLATLEWWISLNLFPYVGGMLPGCYAGYSELLLGFTSKCSGSHPVISSVPLRSLQLGLGYGLTVGFPLSLIGIENAKTWGNSVRSAISLAPIGCMLQLTFILLLLICLIILYLVTGIPENVFASMFVILGPLTLFSSQGHRDDWANLLDPALLILGIVFLNALFIHIGQLLSRLDKS